MAAALIRSYRSADVETCRRLWEELTEWHRTLYDSATIGGDDPGRLFDEHLANVGGENILIAEIDGAVAGMSGLIVTGTEVELDPLVVAAEMRGRGVAAILIGAVVEQARNLGARTVVVKPAARNRIAVDLFHRHGFDVVGQIELMHDLVPGERTWRPADLDDLELRY